MLVVVTLCTTLFMVLLFTIRGCLQKLALRYRAEAADDSAPKKT